MIAYGILIIISMHIEITECSIRVLMTGDDVTADRNQTVTLTWHFYNFLWPGGLFVYYISGLNSETILANIGALRSMDDDIEGLSSKAVSFANRINGSIKLQNGNGTLNLTISEVQLEDGGVFRFQFFSAFPTPRIEDKTRISLNVRGGPYLCQPTFPQNFTMDLGAELSLNITLCGNPRPKVTFLIGDQEFNGTVDESMKSIYQYTYMFTERVSSDMCGRYVRYRAVGYEEQGVTKHSRVFINQFNVTNVVFTQTQTCPRLSWEAAEYGSCDVAMFISFLQKDGSTVNVTVPASGQEYQDCRVTVKSIAVYYKAVVFTGTDLGKKLVLVNEERNRTLATYHYTTLQITKENLCKDNNWLVFEDVFQIIGTFIGGILVGWLFSCCGMTICKKRRRIKEKRKKEESNNIDKISVNKNIEQVKDPEINYAGYTDMRGDYSTPIYDDVDVPSVYEVIPENSS